MIKQKWEGFNAVQNNTSLKQGDIPVILQPCFNAVQNNTSLKQDKHHYNKYNSFNAVQNNTSLKPMINLIEMQKLF